MNSTVKNATAAYIAPKVLRAFRWQWLLYGAAAYFVLKQMQKRGIFPDQAGAAVDLMDHGIDVVKEKIGFQKSETSSPSASGPMH